MELNSVDLLISGGTVVTDAWTGPASVAVQGDRIVALFLPQESVSHLRVGRQVDATGLLVLPGGVDPHCHVAVPIGEFVTLDDFRTATLAALAGGTTTIVDFAIPTPDEHCLTALATKLELASQARCDYSLHGCIAGEPDDVGDTVLELVSRGVRTVKLFTTYRDALMADVDTIEQVMRALRPAGGMAYIHAEDNQLVEQAQQAAVKGGHIDASGMASTRPVEAEAQAVAAVLAAAERADSPVYFVHQSTPAVVDQVVAARQRGVRAFTESCPHYLVLDDDNYRSEHPELFVCCPPLREREQVDGLTQRLVQGFVSTVGSDHCCYDAAQKLRCASDVRIMPNGLPGVETRLPVIWDAFVHTGRISPEHFVELVAAGPARLNGLFPRKGTIAPGSDADLVLFDPNEERVVTASDLHMQTDYTPYEGRRVVGWPTMVVSRGRVVLDQKGLMDPGPVGEFLPAGPIVLSDPVNTN